MALDPLLQKYYEDRFSMCATQGWKDLMADVQNMIVSTNQLSGIEDMRQLGLKQGEVSMMNWILSLQAVSEDAYEQLKEDKNA